MSWLIVIVPLALVALLWVTVALIERAARRKRQDDRHQARSRHYDNVDGVYGHDWKDFR